MNPFVFRAAVAAVALAPSTLCAAFAIFPGPAYDFASNTGYTNSTLLVKPGSTAGDGLAICYASKTVNGVGIQRGFRWSASAAAPVELDALTADTGAANSGVFATNASGTVVGYSNKYAAGATSLGFRATRWDAGGTALTELATLGTTTAGVGASQAFAVNAAGTAVGYAERYANNVSLGTRAVRWDAGGTIATELAPLTATTTTNSVARAINTSGTAVGMADKSGTRAVRWNAGGTAATELGTLGTTNFDIIPNYSESQAWAVNDAGTAVGYAIKFVNNGIAIGYRAVRWNAGTTVATDLGTLGVDQNGGGFSDASCISAGGVVGGYSKKYVNTKLLGDRAVRWDAGTATPTELGNLGLDAGGGTNSEVYAINAAGTLVGYSEKWTNATLDGRRAVLWGPDGAAVDLNALLSPADAARWTLTAARGISDTNYVSGVGQYDPDAAGPLPSYSRAFLMQVPEPVTLGIVGTMTGLLLRRWR